MARLVARLALVEETRLRLRVFLRGLLSVFAGVFLLAVGARASFYVPGIPVPFSLQTMFLAFIVLVYGRRAWRPVAAYLALGLLGVPVFVMGGGPWYVFSPSFGYLLGFLLGAYVAGRYAEPLHLLYPAKLVRVVLILEALVFASGAAWLALFLTATGLSPAEAAATALLVGVAPFLPWDTAKMMAAAALTYTARRIRGTREAKI